MKIKILLIIDAINGGGRERQFVELCKYLSRQPEFVLSVLLCDPKILSTEFLELGIPHRSVCDSLYASSIHICQGIIREIRRFQPDIVHSWGLKTSFLSLPGVFLTHARLIDGSIRDAVPDRKPVHRLMRKIVTWQAAALVANSRAGLTAHHLRVDNPKCHVIYNGMDLQRFSKPASAEVVRSELGIHTRYLVVMTANFSSFKDYRSYFGAAEIVLKKRDDVSFLGIGGNVSPMFDELKRKYASLNHRIFILDRRNDIENIINAADIAVLTSPSEGLSNSIMEYMVLGKPVIANRVGGNMELLADDCGITIPFGDRDGLAETVTMLLDSPHIRCRLGENAKKRMCAGFGLDIMGKAYQSLYHNLAESHQCRNN